MADTPRCNIVHIQSDHCSYYNLYCYRNIERSRAAIAYKVRKETNGKKGITRADSAKGRRNPQKISEIFMVVQYPAFDCSDYSNH